MIMLIIMILILKVIGLQVKLKVVKQPADIHKHKLLLKLQVTIKSEINKNLPKSKLYIKIMFSIIYTLIIFIPISLLYLHL